VEYDLCDLGHIAECAGFLEQAEYLTLASRGSQRTVLEVGRVASPFAQPLFRLGGSVARGIVLVCEGEQVRGNLALVRLLEARQTEGPRLEQTRRGVGLGRGLVRVQWAAVVFGRAILVPVAGEGGARDHDGGGTSYLLGGSCLFPLRRSRLRATGSKSLTSSCGGGGTWSEDASSSSATAADEALRARAGRAARMAGLAELPRAVAVRSGRSRMAMAMSWAWACGGSGMCRADFSYTLYAIPPGQMSAAGMGDS
jgi:hypothetical protein